MKVLSYAIVSYFETISISHNVNMRISTMSPRNKLLLCDKLNIQLEKPIKIKTKSPGVEKKVTAKLKKQREKSKNYRNNKWRAVEGCKKVMTIISMEEKDREIFKSSKKKDDFADAFLQGLWYYMFA